MCFYSNYRMAAPDNYHLELNVHFTLTFNCHPTFMTPWQYYGQEDYTLSNCD